ncbi:SET domain-containing protein [Endozoicomonas lisbonensis]|uniref:SET domain-containing protein n=1 Tax=Endozoicomonas lisbonensis TaxID=3120522 RepID=A0ABV2SN24_9GAMM
MSPSNPPTSIACQMARVSTAQPDTKKSNAGLPVQATSTTLPSVRGKQADSRRIPKARKRTCQLMDNTANPNGPQSSKKKRRLPDKKDLYSIGHGLTVSESTIAGAGNGLFADQDIDKGEFITWYGGPVINVDSEEREKLSEHYEDWSHLAGIDRHTVIQSPKQPEPGMGGGGFINDGINIFTPPNVTFVPISERQCIYIKSLRPIDKGEELFVSYGTDYWKRFQDQFPDDYQKFFAPQLRNRKEARKLLDRHSSHMQSVTRSLKKNPLPLIPEWQDSAQGWSSAIARYALHKAGVTDRQMLNPSVLRKLNSSSNEYFNSVAHYASSLKVEPKRIADSWNNKARNEPLSIPGNGVFKPADRWQAAHIHIFCTLLKPEYHLDTVQLKNCLKVLDPSTALYEYFLDNYIRSVTKLEPGGLIDFNTPEDKKLKKKLDKNFRDITPPQSYRGQPFTANQPAPKKQGWSLWTLPMIYQLLRQYGITVKEHDDTKNSYLSDLVEHAGKSTVQDELQYFQTLKNWAQQRNFNFMRIPQSFSEKLKKTGSPESHGTSDSTCFPFKKTEGLNLNNYKYISSALFLQYIEHFGFDDPGIVNSLSSATIYRSLALFHQPVSPTLSALYEQLFSLAWRNLPNKHAALIIMKRYPDLALPCSVEKLPFGQAFETLKKKGLEFESQIKDQASGNEKRLSTAAEVEPDTRPPFTPTPETPKMP